MATRHHVLQKALFDKHLIQHEWYHSSMHEAALPQAQNRLKAADDVLEQLQTLCPMKACTP